ncbi:MAG: hypothetical protein KDJ31_00545 [Candidatus Competibacteraceae bacterium]|nr:hypothetical protein [Candidatus Competibacteraceae bacterium]MCB1820948.1 hypothetical protein [Candidatus Competibacteraceae bacterium]
MLLLVAPLLLGADDSYLREIEEEAKRQAAMLIIDQAAPSRPEATAANNKGETTADRLASGLDQAAFEQALRESLPGTYALYQQFDTARKQQVYIAYQSDSRFAHISEQVIQLLSGKL